jgi:lipopolysaccharide biosynthesis regulator YciM
MRLQSFPSVIALAAAVTLQAQQQPKPKSQKEVDALQKVQAAAQAQNYDGELQAINNVLENFADTEYKPMLLNMAMDAAQRKGDQAQVTVYGERVLEADPNNIPARVLLAESIAGRTRENDLDKEQSLKKAEDYANKALDLLKTASTPPTGMTPEQWPDYKKELTSQSYDALGQSADLRKNYPDAIKNFKSAMEAQPTNAVAMARLSKAYVGAKQYDDAISTADKVLAMNDAPASVKQFAQSQKDAATKLKGAATPAK